jgi:hypothetical protein
VISRSLDLSKGLGAGQAPAGKRLPGMPGPGSGWFRFGVASLALALAATLAPGATFMVTNTDDSGAGSLRQAILDANASAGFDTIAFAIPGAGVHTITPLSALPIISEGVLIDGYSQPGASENSDPVATNAVLLIELDGSTVGYPGTGLKFSLSPGTVQGLVLNGWTTAIDTSSGGSTLRGNFVGTDPTGTVAKSNSAGVLLHAGDVVGGTSPGDRNLISGNGACCNGMGIAGSGVGALIQGNLIGTDVTGTKAIPNGHGIALDGPGVTIGGTAAGAGNVVSGNVNGIDFSGDSSGVVLQGNRIGTTADGTGSLGNTGWGITANGSGASIGGIGPGEGNVIAHNTVGVFVWFGLEDTIRGNSIHDNLLLGIALGAAVPWGAPTPNDTLDTDSGANLHQNFPILQSVEHLEPAGAGSTRILGKLNSAPSTTFDLDFYSNPACSNFPREFLEGETYLGSSQVMTDGSGGASIDVTLPVVTEAGARISATATDPAGNTSEFSQRILFSISPVSGSASGGQPFTAYGTDFADPTALTVDGVPATGVTFVDDHTLTATMPTLASPGASHDVVAVTPDGTTGTLIKGWVTNFLDVPSAHNFYDYVTALVSNSITAGVGGGNYGVDQPTLRQQMAAFILKAKHGLCYTPPACVGMFNDVPCTSTFARWIEAMAAEGITAGCGNGNFCPTEPVRREQMAVFLLKGEHGSNYAPPACTGIFLDVGCPSTYASWIEQLAAEYITTGCGNGNFCPLANNTRGQMAVFLVRTFGLTQ